MSYEDVKRQRAEKEKRLVCDVIADHSTSSLMCGCIR